MRSVTGYTSNGQVDIEVEAGKTPGVAHIAATSGNAKATIAIDVVAVPVHITVSGPTTFTSQKYSTHYVMVTVTDANGNPIAGIPVIASSNDVSIMSPQQAPVKTNAQGQATIQITSGGQAGTTYLDVSAANGLISTRVLITTT